MESRDFAIVQALARAALIAAAELPEKHPSRGIVRHQVDRLKLQLQGSANPHDRLNGEKIESLVQWFDDGAIPSTERVVLSEAV
jgi:hypothetical protein